MAIELRPFNKHDAHFSNVIELFFEAFPKAQRLPEWLMKLRIRNGKTGFDVLYEDKTWVGFIYVKPYRDVIFIKFFAISGSLRSRGYGSKVLDALKQQHSNKRIVLNIEELDENEDNFQQRVKRKAFYVKNGFVSTGYIVKEPAERQEMLIYNGTISAQEIADMYRCFLGNLLFSLLKPEVLRT